MSAMWLSKTCRVCLARDREMYRLANTALEETYERVTSGTLVVEGRPCCVCGVCLSALRRCRRFIDTAREANDALDRWIHNHPNTDMLKLKERSLLSFTRSITEVFEIVCLKSVIQEPGIKQERAENEYLSMIDQQLMPTSDDEGNIPMMETKYEVTSDDDKDMQMSDIESHNTQVIKSECINVYDDMIDIEDDAHTVDDVKFDISELLDNVRDETNAYDDGSIQSSSDEEIPLQILRSRKRAKLNEENRKNKYKGLMRTEVHSDGESDSLTDQIIKKSNNNTDISINNVSKLDDMMNQTLVDIFEIPEIDNVGSEEASVSNAGRNQKSSEGSLRKLRSGKTVKLTGDTERGPALKKRRLITSEHRHGNTDPAATLHNGGDTFSCSLCKYNTTNKYNFKVHLLIHSDKKLFACDKCDYKCNYKARLKTHLVIHTGEKPFACDKCYYKCNFKVSLKSHLLTHTDKKPYACDKCDYRSRQKCHLNRHLMTHTPEKPLACDKCDFKCKQKIDLIRHLIRHTGEKPLSCDKCDYKCMRQISLNKHLLSHNREKMLDIDKPFACDKCDYKCQRYPDLKRHLMRHTGQKPFACDKCDYKCIRQISLNQHLLSHTGEKPLACDKCDYKCIRNSHLKSHLKTHLMKHMKI